VALITCPSCGYRLQYLEDVVQDSLSCPNCGTELDNLRAGGPAATPAGQAQAPVPKRLPRRLGDPLRLYRLFLSVMLVLLVCLIGRLVIRGFLAAPPGQRMAQFFTADDDDAAAPPAVLVAALLLWVPGLFWVWSILPSRRTNALYLRSFRYDEYTWPIRQAIQAALGRGFRLSGIRDPRRRWPPVIRYMLAGLFAFRYSTPRYMNLEAGGQWKARLWRSLGDARCAFIDVSDLTSFVEEEIELCERCLGPERVLFVSDVDDTAEDCRRRVMKVLGRSQKAGQVHVAVWKDTPAGREAFAKAVGQFADALPPGTAGLRYEALPLAGSSGAPGEGQPAREGAGWVELLVGVFLGVSLFVGFAIAAIAVLDQADRKEVASTEALLTWEFLGEFLVVLLLDAVVLGFFVGYVRDCGSRRERVRATATFAACLVGSVALYAYLLPVALESRLEPLRRRQSGMNLREIGIAMSFYADRHDSRFPPTWVSGPDRRPLLSWRVAILPHLGPDERELFAKFRLDEPWDGPNNRPLLEHMPRVYAASGRDKEAARGLTYYQVFDGPGAALDRFFGVPQSAFSDGTGNTILVVEAADPVPWTCPEDLPFVAQPPAGAEAPLPRLGCRRGPYFEALMADGSYLTLRKKLDPAQLRALVTRAGGEVVDLRD
jgi:hypothetical protein